jgi:hypothetical protein
MAYKYALLCMHGMGDLENKEKFKPYVHKVKQGLSERMPANDLSKVYIPEYGIFYSNITQGEEDKVWDNMQSDGGLDTGWIRRNTINNLRRFVLYGFADATAFSGFDSSVEKQPYTLAQDVIRTALTDVYKNCGIVPIVLLSHSLGCQIISNYLWDAQLYARGLHTQIDERSIWHPNNYVTSNNAQLDEFLLLKSLKIWFTIGCN